MKTLLLNANFYPLQIVRMERAVRLVLEGRAYVVEEYEQQWRSERVSFGAPCVIALREYVRVPKPRHAVTRTGIFVRDDYECQYCGAPAENIDHIVPQSKGGPNTWENLVAACISCNSRKGSKSLAQLPDMQLRKPPRVPHLNYRFYKERNPHWQPYLL